jgi:phosphoglycolate phosphatase
MTAACADVRGVLVDLDGTLLDTAADLAAGVNRMLAGLGLPAVSTDEVKTWVGKGIAMLVRRAIARDLAGDADPVLAERGLRLFEAAYAEESGRAATVYPGVIEGLSAFRALGLRLACMTNKAERFTRDLLALHRLDGYFEVVACGDTLPRRKPDPLPVLWCCERLHLAPAQVLVVGDSLNDVQAARAAGCRVFCVPYGYNEGQPVASLDCDRVVATLAEAAALLRAARLAAGA